LRFARFVKLVGAANVRLGRVAYEVHGIWRLADTMSILPPLLEYTCGELEGAELGFAKRDCLEFLADNSFEHSFEGGAKGSHSNSREIVVTARAVTHTITGVRNIKYWGVTYVAQITSLWEKRQVGPHQKCLTACLGGRSCSYRDLLVACPVSAISEYKDGLDFDLAIIPRS
jgi:hypothetical protein